MKNILLLWPFLLISFWCQAQYFQATIDADGRDLVFKLRPQPGGGDITTKWTDIEFFIRWPKKRNDLQFGQIRVNYQDFPGITITDNGDDIQGTETEYSNRWFGSSFSTTPEMTYVDGQEYEVFRVSLNKSPLSVDLELVHNTLFKPHYLALINENGTDLTPPAGNVFYGLQATVRPSVDNNGLNHLAPLGHTIPGQSLTFQAQTVDNEKVQLDWAPITGTRPDFYVVERSVDGHQFTPIEEIRVLSGTPNRYDFKTFDEHPSVGVNYYRLRQVYADRSYDYSPVRMAAITGTEYYIRVFPNPASDLLHMAFSAPLLDAEVRLYNDLYQLIIQHPLEMNSTKDQLNLGHLPKGIYWLEVHSEKALWKEKIVVQ
ncbi:MAG: T9SS type A sorting domain-containing protein [Lewinellaceae bacterium]|nr:T9SS type A sorting domain-containing protein [Lewinellaceae bacterium]